MSAQYGVAFYMNSVECSSNGIKTTYGFMKVRISYVN